MDEIRSRKQKMLLAPSDTPIEVEIKKVRQAAYKFEFTSRRKSAAAPIDGSSN